MSTSTHPPADQHDHDRMETDPRTAFHNCCHDSEPEFYTLEQLQHATADHLHLTSRRFFIGPIPKGWLQNHRRSWYKTRLKFRNYTSRAVTFSAETQLNPSAANPDISELQLPTTDQEEDGHEDTTEEGEEGEQESEPSSQRTIRPSSRLRTLNEPLGAGETLQTPTPSQSEHSEDPTAREGDSTSYFTARETRPGSSLIRDIPGDYGSGANTGIHTTQQKRPIPSISSTQYEASQSSPKVPSSDYGSTSALLKPSPGAKGKERLNKPISTDLMEHHEPQSELDETDDNNEDRPRDSTGPRLSLSRQAARFNLDDNIMDKKRRLQSRLARTHGLISDNIRFPRKLQEGEIIRAENMLVRVEETLQNLPDDYTENDSLRMETRVADNWREFLVVCRVNSNKHAPFSLQMYKTRVIPEIQKQAGRASPHYEITLGRKQTRVNLYSSLDKSIVIWEPSKRGTRIYIVRPRSTAHAVEWFTSICLALGWHRPTSLPISVPHLGVSLIFKNPFEQFEADADNEVEGDEEDILARLAKRKKLAATSIIRGCMEMLSKNPEWADVLEDWSKTGRMGLAWKRYDRLEWIYGVREEKMYGSLGIQTTHELELRPRQHYCTFVNHDNMKENEPEPVEGFLIRLTSQRGVHQRMNKMFYKRLYFFTQDHYLFFCRPAKALPPAPPRLCPSESEIPSTQDILNQMPLSYAVDPFPVANGEITWLSSGNKAHIKSHDQEAYALLRRNLHNICNADGHIDLCQVQEIRHVQRDSCPADPNIREGPPDVRFHPEAADTHRDDGATQNFEDDRTFELVLVNGLVARFQTYNNDTKAEWMKRLDALVRYWRARVAADATEHKVVRKRNLDILEIDEDLESIIGQHAKKWEVKKTEASPFIHNMCSLLGCRAIKMSGSLYRKPRRHATFKQCNVVLADGKLLIFQSSLRKRNGVEIPHIHSSFETSIDLDDCYVYSGLITESDLLYSNQTFDSNRPGHRTLPRVYLASDVFTSSDEDTAITFVVWQPLRKNYFRARERGKRGQTTQKIKHVTTLGAHGRTIVFKARTRVEKDQWVMSIVSEIDRLQENRPDDIRIIHR
ncbi:Pleckstrin homology domain-containing protein [Aspergillus ambiguus]|uniref:sporulation-specific 71 family protein n=1 Tax=Aspergillus ambiguus TaxID=176160 RepID=UPI003CCDF7EC